MRHPHDEAEVFRENKHAAGCTAELDADAHSANPLGFELPLAPVFCAQ